MKTKNKLTTVMALVAIVVLSLAVIGCEDESDPGPSVRGPEKIEFGTNNTLYTMLSSSKALTDDQWTSVKIKLTTALDSASTSSDPSLAGSCAGIFNGTVNIDLLATTPGYSYYKIDTTAGKILFNADYVIGATNADLLAKLIMAINGPIQAKVIDNSRNTVRIVYATVPDTVFA
jgi:ABC-type uncharacterized transport system substrate-binding protein